ncbi:MAG: spore coat protein U domain-containing protein, partial [Gammaproteobacteria bacterium]
MKHLAVGRSIGLFAALVPSLTLAATPVTTSFTVQVQILSSCAVATPATLNFGLTPALASNVDASTGVQVTC